MSEISEINYIAINKLIPYDKNNKKHTKAQIEKLKASITEFGFTSPLLLDDKNVIIAGHGRLAAAKELEMKEIPCVYVTGLTDPQLKALRIADNKLAELGETDWNNLKLEFDDLKLEGLEDLTGFQDKDFDFLKEKEGISDLPKVNNGIVQEKRLKHLAICPNCNHEFKLKED